MELYGDSCNGWEKFKKSQKHTDSRKRPERIRGQKNPCEQMRFFHLCVFTVKTVTCTVCMSLFQKAVHESPQSSARGSASQQKKGCALYLIRSIMPWKASLSRNMFYSRKSIVRNATKDFDNCSILITGAEIIGCEIQHAALDVAFAVRGLASPLRWEMDVISSVVLIPALPMGKRWAHKQLGWLRARRAVHGGRLWIWRGFMKDPLDASLLRIPRILLSLTQICFVLFTHCFFNGMFFYNLGSGLLTHEVLNERSRSFWNKHHPLPLSKIWQVFSLCFFFYRVGFVALEGVN